MRACTRTKMSRPGHWSTGHGQANATVKTLLVVRSGGRLVILKPCGLVCVAYPYARAILCPIASVALLIALRSPLRLSSRLCCHRRCLNLACLHASPRPQHLSHRLLALPSYQRPRGLRCCHRHRLHGELLVRGVRPRLIETSTYEYLCGVSVSFACFLGV